VWSFWLMPGMALLICVNIVNRVRSGLRQAARLPS
jgi:hypothetical protein